MNTNQPQLGFKEPSLIKRLTIKYSRQIAVTIGLMLILIIIALMARPTDAAIVSSEEIAKNSLRHQELQANLSEVTQEIRLLEDERGRIQEEQKYLETRNDLLRKVFTQGENQ